MIQYNPLTKEVFHPQYGCGELRDIAGDLMLFSFPGSLSIWEDAGQVKKINIPTAEMIWRNHKCKAS